MATRFALADGRNTWARPIDETADDNGSSNSGTVIAARSGRVYVYGADDRPAGADGFTSYRYTIQALDADTGKVIWKTVTGEGDEASEPNAEQGASIGVPEGVITVHGAKGQQYALLGAADGKVRWKRPIPDSDTKTCLLRSAARNAYLVCQTWGEEEGGATGTSISQLDRTTGRPRWTVSVDGEKDVVGQADGRLVVLDTTGVRRTLTLIHATSHVMTTVRLSQPQPEGTTPTLLGDRLYVTSPSGGVRAVAPDSGRQLWESNSTVESPGIPVATASHLYLASPSGRLAALNLRTGTVEATLQGRDDGGTADFPGGGVGPPPTLAGDALYVPYGVRSVYTVDIRTLHDD
ncbi:outer membrane protein assembly factor BamB family protein [Streptomyces muensis]